MLCDLRICKNKSVSFVTALFPGRLKAGAKAFPKDEATFLTFRTQHFARPTANVAIYFIPFAKLQQMWCNKSFIASISCFFI